MNSDHSPVFFELDIETYIPKKLRLNYGIKEAVDIVNHIHKALDTALPKTMAGHPTRQIMEDMENAIENIFLTFWNKFASISDVSTHAKFWWNTKCSKCIKQIHFITNHFYVNKLQLQWNREHRHQHHANSCVS